VHRPTTLLAALLVCACLPSTARAAPSAKLHVAFIPERLGQHTTLEFSAQIAAPNGMVVPPPLTTLDVRYPGDLGVAVGELGLATCSKTRLEAFGTSGCPADSRMGEGSATAEIPIGPEIVQETAKVAILRAPEQEGHLALLLYATGETPVSAQIAFPALLLPSPPPYGASIHINVPLVPSLPDGPDVAVVRLHATIGPRGLIYYERVRGRLVSYKPQGILLPKKCPRDGFAFSVTFTFLDGSHANARTSVPCPSGDAPHLPHDASPARRR
jgi:hypothetical protein